MRGVANSILIAMLVGVFITTFSNFIMFFPWYFTLVYETFNVSIRASNINYIDSTITKEARDDLINRPIFNKLSRGDIKILMNDTEISENNEQNTFISYLQRGETFDVTIESKFPFIIKFGDVDFRREAEIKFTIPTTGIRYYKDLEGY